MKLPAGPLRLTPTDAGRYARLRLRMLTESPWAFAASPEDDATLDRAHLTSLLAEDQNAIFACEAVPSMAGSRPDVEQGSDEQDLVAAAGILRMKRVKFAHRARIWGVYVEPNYRGRGLGRAVVSAALELARSWPGVEYVDLGVSAHAPPAQRLYESLGFIAWGREPDATAHGCLRYDEVYMTLKL